jgi:hypothetical protein
VTRPRLLPRLIVNNEKLFVAMLTYRGGIQHRASWPFQSGLLLAVRTEEFVLVKTGVDVSQSKRSLRSSEVLSDFAGNRHPKSAAEEC